MHTGIATPPDAPSTDALATPASSSPALSAPPRRTKSTPSARTSGRAINKLLRDVFGVAVLRDGQQAVIDSVLSGCDTLAIMPTGSGKSLCYQIPATLSSGTTIVVSPLISLMKDQLQKLSEIGIGSTQVNSSLSREEEAAALDSIADGSARIVFCTPERLTAPEFLQVLRKCAIALVVIDEAHCISQWGHDFRPAYLELAAAIAALGRPPVLALTATATEQVVEDIGRQLGLPKLHVVNTGIYRPNLRYSVIQTTNPDEKLATAMRLVRDTEGVGIVYAATVKAAGELHEKLLQAGENVTLYHGKLPARERKANQDAFMNGASRIMVATNAFGMGIDKSDTRFVIHLQVPANLEAYYQESGRAGRDGLPAACTLLYFADDKRIQQFFLGKNYPVAEELYAVFDAVQELAAETSAAHAATSSSSPTSASASYTFEAIRQKLDAIPLGKLKICLKLLKDGKLLRQDRKLNYLIRSQKADAAAKAGAMPNTALFAQLAQGYVDKQERDRIALEQMVSYAQSGYCRWKLLLDYFGDKGDFDRCCTCDNCLAPPVVASLDNAHFGDAPQEAQHTTPLADKDLTLQDQAAAAAGVDAVRMTPATATPPAAPPILVGARVRVPRFDSGTVVAVEGDMITIEFPEHLTKTFMAEFVAPE